MSFSSPTAAQDVASGGDGSGAGKPTFGQKLLNGYESSHPIVGALLNGVTGYSPTLPQFQPVQADQVPLTDYTSLVAQNAQPKQSGLGLKILQALMG